MTRSADILIVGAGPAGSHLGYLLARDGFKVAIVDKCAFPRDKVCGGGLSNKTIELLPFDLSPVIERRIKGALLTYRNRDTVVKDLDQRGGVAVLRSEFDRFLLEKAIDAGARFHGETPFVSVEKRRDGVVVTTGRGAITARYLVGADGVFSQVRRFAFGPDLVKYAPAVEAIVSVTPDKAERIGDRVLFDFGGMPRGYGWIFPKKDHLNVGIFSMYPTGSIRNELARFMSRYDVLDGPLQVKQLGWSIPVRNRRREFERDHVLLVGDAGGFAECFYGEGIYFALKSSRIAARALVVAFDRPAERAYTSLVQAELQPDLSYSEITARLFYSHQKLGFYLMARNAHVNHYFAELIGGGVRPRECFYKTILTSPYWLFSRKLPRLPSLEGGALVPPLTVESGS